MIYEDRPYQIEAEDALLKDLNTYYGVHPIIAVPTGGGKTKIMGSFIYKYLEENPHHKILVISFTEEILKQDYEAICSFFPGIIIGLYSSGLHSKTIEKITVAGIQSIYRKPELFTEFNLAIIDECHTVPVKGNGMFRKFFKYLSNIIRVGLSATPFRTDHGYLHQGEGSLFNKLSYNLCTMSKFNQLIEDGYLCDLYSKPTDLQLNPTHVKILAGDYSVKDLSENFDRESITIKAIKETIEFGHNYKSWLIFAIDIQHAENINSELIKSGIKSSCIHSKMSGDRKTPIENFKSREIRALVSVGMITTGFDAPNVDMIVLLRPTQSPVLHVQMVGRGLRPNKGKDHCLVLDFSGNTSRLGPINNVQVPDKKKKKKNKGKPIVKRCPVCGCLHHPTVKICNACEHVFVFKEKIKVQASNKDIVQRTKEKWLTVSGIVYSLHTKVGKPSSLKVSYRCGLSVISEYICYNHTGYAKVKANNWVQHRWDLKEFPKDVASLHEHSKFLKQPKRILVSQHNKYPSIVNAEF